MKTIADVLREEGIEQGKQQGKQEGIAETLFMVLGYKLGQLPEDMQKQFRRLDEQTLKSIVNNYDQINTLQDLSHYL